MKMILNVGLVLGFVFCFSLTSDAQRPKNQVVFADSTYSLTFSLEVANIIDNKCYGCHSPNSRNEKAKEKFTWMGIQTLEAVDAVGFLEEMHEVLTEGAMPPKKMLERFPNAKLTDEEVATLKAWVTEVQSKLMDE